MEAWSKMKMDNRAAAVIRAYCKEYVAPAPVKDAMVVMDEADSTWFSNLASFAKREEMRGARWSADETEMFYWGMITKLKENRLLAAFSDKVTGFVGPDHYADIRLKHPERKFKQGATVKCRILNVDSN
ncbi:rRNA biogenesis protein rrp5 [Ceratobasidium sp. UAMH 11750]|nr:rRNA biogenesis protein rrp5 [Ceratobasidium sp. UAMH 11750]